VDVRFVREFRTFVPLARLRERRDLDGLILLRPGTRLSVIPVSPAHAKVILRLGDGS
jgi:predicted RNA-binding protein with PUA-like domain